MKTPDLRAEVAAAAGHQCACTGQCGLKHKPKYSKRPARCERAELLPVRPLHAVPRQAVPEHLAVRLGADGLMAACEPCAADIARRQAAELRAQPAPPTASLLDLVGGAA